MSTPVMTLVGVVLLLLGLATGFCVRRGEESLRFLGIGAFGLLAGVSLGLSSSPVLAGTITSVLGLLAASVPALRSANQSDLLDTTKLLLPFSLLALVGILSGITIRTNDLLLFKAQSLRTHYEALGFDEGQTKRIMDHFASLPEHVPDLSRGKVSLLGELRLSDLQQLRSRLGDGFFVEHLSKLRSFADAITRMKTEGKTDEEIADAIMARQQQE